MYNPFTDYINQIQNKQSLANQSNRSKDKTFMLNTETTKFYTLSRPPLAPLIYAGFYSSISTINNPFQLISNLNTASNPCQTLYQPRIAHNIGSSAFFLSSSSTLNPIHPSSVGTQNYTVPFVAMKKPMEAFDGLNHQYTPEAEKALLRNKL